MVCKVIKVFFISAVSVALFAIYNGVVQNGMQESVIISAIYIAKALILNYKFWLIAFAFSAILYFVLKNTKIVFEICFKYRYLLSLILFAFCVWMEISGSSIGMWSSVMGLEDEGVVLGTSREIRSDEWFVSTPMALSQYMDAQGSFSYYNHIIRGTVTDVFLEYGQPVRDIAVIFRPFHWGYLFLSAGKGLAFYWCGRYIALFLVSFEMGRILTKDNKKLALAYSVLIGWAPVVQWWFAVNGLVEMLIYMQLSILLLIQFMITQNRKKRFVCTIGIMICAGGYLFTMYPAWQVPLAYILLGLAIWTFWEYHNRCVMKVCDWLMIAAVSIVFLALVIYVFYKSWDTVTAILNTAYPGERFERGGGLFVRIFNYVSTIVYALYGEGTEGNVCESAQVIDFFPMCYIIPLFVFFKDKVKDKLLVIMFFVSLFLEMWVIVEFPNVLAKITLLSNCQPGRVVQVVGFANVILLIRAMALIKRNNGMVVSFGFGIILSVIIFMISRTLNPGYYGRTVSFMVLFTFGILFSFMQLVPKPKWTNLWVGMCCIIMFISGFLVNPIRRGVGNIYDLECIEAVEEVHKKDKDALWIVEGAAGVVKNLPIMAGAPTINSTNVYPVLDRWHLIDEDRQYEEIYNRYAHIDVYCKKEGNAEFYSDFPDRFTVEMTLEDMKKINATYILSVNDLKSSSDTDIILERQAGAYKIYKLK